MDELVELLPDRPGGFAGTDFPLPVKSALLGTAELRPGLLRRELLGKRNGDIRDLLEPVLLAAELHEASREDRARFFITDQAVQSYVFGAKWHAGWVLLLGAEREDGLMEGLKDQNLLVFTDRPDIPDTCCIGGRATSPIYFLQLMVRYGLVWGRIAPGDDHEMGHFLERDMPGFIVIRGGLEPLKLVVALGLMKLGAPAVVPSSFPFPYGRRIVADESGRIIDAGLHFPNLRVRRYRGELIGLPEFCNPAHAAESFEAEAVCGGGSSFFCLRSARRVDSGVEVLGEPSREIGILVEVAHPRLGDDLALLLERTALKSLSYLSGVKAQEQEGSFSLALRSGAPLDSGRIAAAIHWGLRLSYPRLKRIRVRIVYDREVLQAQAAGVRRYKERRRDLMAAMTEQTAGQLCVCTECRPFSLEHTCILTPERVPMCASRTYFTVKAAALLGPSRLPYQRRSEQGVPLQAVFRKGRVLDLNKGEYAGCNRAYRRMTRGRLRKVYLHSLRGYPHTSCGCFQNLAFWIEEVRGIGIMSRHSQAVTAAGETWATLANRAGGKQSHGIMGVSLGYIRSSSFLKGDGGLRNVVWVDGDLYEKIADLLPPGQRVATDGDVRDIEELRAFTGR